MQFYNNHWLNNIYDYFFGIAFVNNISTRHKALNIFTISIKLYALKEESKEE